MSSQTPLTIEAAAEWLRAGRTTAVALTRDALELADRCDSELGSYATRFDESAMVTAERADAELAAGRDRGPLQGIPIGVKDIISTEEGPTRANSLVYDPTWGEGRDASVVARLREAGAVICGKTSTMEFACGFPQPSDPFVPRNPWNTRCWSGGSSSGSGSGVAAGLFLGAVGTDSAGSIRIPAAFCGVTGFKPTFGLVPTSGCLPIDASLDTVGPIARSARSVAMMLDAMVGSERATDARTIDIPNYAAALDGSLEGLRVGVDLANTLRSDALSPIIDPFVEPALDVSLLALKGAGATVTEIELPLFTELQDVVLLTGAAEAFTHHRDRLRQRWNDYSPAARLFLITGAMMSAGDYLLAQRVRRFGRDQLLAAFDNVDVIITPTACAGAPEIEAQALTAFYSQIFTTIWNAVGFPAVSVPMGFVEGGMPVGMHIAGKPFDDATVLRVADAFQRLTSWHLEVPAHLTASATL
jgi:aspartyl-tRNA(Asn)/glutamyl-tRNA(Gln) amidotransferase subunit A